MSPAGSLNMPNSRRRRRRIRSPMTSPPRCHRLLLLLHQLFSSLCVAWPRSSVIFRRRGIAGVHSSPLRHDVPFLYVVSCFASYRTPSVRLSAGVSVPRSRWSPVSSSTPDPPLLRDRIWHVTAYLYYCTLTKYASLRVCVRRCSI